MKERRYDEDEVREIFSLATSGNVPDPPPADARDGLTLAEIQGIAREVGLEPQLVARAASALDRQPARPMRRSFGMPIEVGRLLPLQRNLTDLEWEQLVAELRMTFGATGRVAAAGGSRVWSNGNLHACVEPTEEGYRLRLGTLKGDAVGVNALGLVGVLAGGVVTAATVLAGTAPNIAATGFLGALGAGAFLVNLLRLSRWTRERERQMDHIAAKTESLIARSDSSP